MATSELPVMIPAGELIHLSWRTPSAWQAPLRHSRRHWRFIAGGWDIQRPAVMLRGRVQDGTRRLYAASINKPTMLVPVIYYRSFAEMQLRILGVDKAVKTFEKGR